MLIEIDGVPVDILPRPPVRRRQIDWRGLRIVALPGAFSIYNMGEEECRIRLVERGGYRQDFRPVLKPGAYLEWRGPTHS